MVACDRPEQVVESSPTRKGVLLGLEVKEIEFGNWRIKLADREILPEVLEITNIKNGVAAYRLSKDSTGWIDGKDCFGDIYTLYSVGEVEKKGAHLF